MQTNSNGPCLSNRFESEHAVRCGNIGFVIYGKLNKVRIHDFSFPFGNYYHY